jgi:hypothetical protein
MKLWLVEHYGFGYSYTEAEFILYLFIIKQ